MKNLKQLLPKEVLEVLSEESVGAIETALTQKTEIIKEAALSEQDEQYAAKLEKLLEAIDADCTLKLKRVVEAVDKNNTKKLKKVVRRYEHTLNEDAKKFKSQIVNSISDFIDQYIDDAIPAEAITEAVRNKTATNVLSNLRSVLAVDSALMKESVKEAIYDGKSQIASLQKQLAEANKERKIIAEQVEKTKAALILERKTAGMTDARKKHLMKTLSDKPVQYIEENFDYVKDLVIKNEKARNEELKNEAFKTRRIKSDVITESANKNEEREETTNPYLNELKKFK